MTTLQRAVQAHAETGSPDVAGTSLDDALAQARESFNAGQLKQAEQICRQILRTHPREGRALYRLGKIALAAGAPGLAEAFARRAVALSPDEPSFHRALGDALRGSGKLAQAEASVRRAVELAPGDPRVHGSLSMVLVDQARLAEALQVIQRAIECAPEQGSIYVSQGFVYLLMGRAEDAVASFRQATELDPMHPHFRAGLLFSRHYLPDVEARRLFDEAREWGRRHAQPLADGAPRLRNDPDPSRRLRIGYVSGDFQQHPVGRVLQAVLPAHDAAEVEVFCYATRRCTDQFAKQLFLASDHWRSLVELGDEAAADLIRGDEIDILVDLSGHTGHNRLLVAARKPAPIQAVWLGYFDTTGMSSIDYIFADQFVCPPGDEAFFVEDVVRLPGSFLCYRPVDPSPAVSPPPMRARGHVTFGSLNNIAKVGPGVVQLWSEILRAVPDARIVLKYGGLADATVRERFLSLFGSCGVDAERVSLLGASPLGEHLTAYDGVDIALDPFPYNGGITTLDALWMGTPVVTLRGDRFVGRMGASTLSALGLHELIAETPAEYVEKAVCLARDPDRVSALRGGLRQRLLDSPICDGAAFARALEASYREMWRKWCRSQLALGA